MTWKVIARDPGPGGEAFEILCDTQEQVADHIVDQEARGREVEV